MQATQPYRPKAKRGCRACIAAPCPFSDWRCTTETVIIEQPIMPCLLACVAMPQPRLDCWLGCGRCTRRRWCIWQQLDAMQSVLKRQVQLIGEKHSYALDSTCFCITMCCALCCTRHSQGGGSGQVLRAAINLCAACLCVAHLRVVSLSDLTLCGLCATEEVACRCRWFVFCPRAFRGLSA